MQDFDKRRYKLNDKEYFHLNMLFRKMKRGDKVYIFSEKQDKYVLIDRDALMLLKNRERKPLKKAA